MIDQVEVEEFDCGDGGTQVRPYVTSPELGTDRIPFYRVRALFVSYTHRVCIAAIRYSRRALPGHHAPMAYSESALDEFERRLSVSAELLGREPYYTRRSRRMALLVPAVGFALLLGDGISDHVFRNTYHLVVGAILGG